MPFSEPHPYFIQWDVCLNRRMLCIWELFS